MNCVGWGKGKENGRWSKLWRTFPHLWKEVKPTIHKLFYVLFIYIYRPFSTYKLHYNGLFLREERIVTAGERSSTVGGCSEFWAEIRVVDILSVSAFGLWRMRGKNPFCTTHCYLEFSTAVFTQQKFKVKFKTLRISKNATLPCGLWSPLLRLSVLICLFVCFFSNSRIISETSRRQLECLACQIHYQ